ncbi:MAG: 30S ribosomal protein THX [Steroidobacteraceae bacterium]
MGKGDRKTRRGKIYRGSFGKSRPKDPSKNKNSKKKTVTRSGTSKK